MSSWDFINGMAMESGYSARLEGDIGNLQGQVVNLQGQVVNLQGHMRYHRAVAASYCAAKDALKEALIEVAPHHPLVDGDDGRQLLQSIGDKAYNDEYMNGYRDEAPAAPEPTPAPAPSGLKSSIKNLFNRNPPADPKPEPVVPTLADYTEKGIKGSSLNRR
jgi:hypothetical protein